MKSIVVFGSGVQAGNVIDIIEAEAKFKIKAILCDYGKLGSSINSYTVVGGLELLKDGSLPQVGIVAVGDNYFREQNVFKLKEVYPNISFVSSVHASATIVKNATVGEGTVIHPQAYIGNAARIGKHCIISTRALIGHDVVIEEYATIGPNAIVARNTVVAKGSLVGMGSVVRDRTKIGEYTVIGIGSVVLEDIPSYVVAYGNPAKVIRSRKKDERFYRAQK